MRIILGNFTLLNVPAARAKAKRYGAAILDGKDPVIARRELKAELNLHELTELFYSIYAGIRGGITIFAGCLKTYS